MAVSAFTLRFFRAARRRVYIMATNLINLRELVANRWRVCKRDGSLLPEDCYIPCRNRGVIFAVGAETLRLTSTTETSVATYKALSSLQGCNVSPRGDDKIFTADFAPSLLAAVVAIVRPLQLTPQQKARVKESKLQLPPKPEPAEPTPRKRICPVCNQRLWSSNPAITTHIQCNVARLDVELFRESRELARERAAANRVRIDAERAEREQRRAEKEQRPRRRRKAG